MKKYMALVMMLICISGMTGCEKTISGAEVYSFPESVAQIKVTVYSQGRESETVMEADNPEAMFVVEWYYGLELISCDRPEDVEGAKVYSFTVNDEPAFSYEDRGIQTYIIVSDTWYEVKNPSNPPIG